MRFTPPVMFFVHIRTIFFSRASLKVMLNFSEMGYLVRMSPFPKTLQASSARIVDLVSKRHGNYA